MAPTPSSTASTDDTGVQHAAPALAIRNLTYRYAPSAPLVVDVPRFDLAAGEQVLLTGNSGCGKSTLLHLVAGLVDPESGEVRIGERAGEAGGAAAASRLAAGRAIHTLRGAARDRFRGAHVGMIFQTFHLLHGFSALENVTAALAFAPTDVPSREHDERARELLTRLGLERHDAKPEELSVGQQQRVAVARAVVCRPTLVLADEPTASLDPDNAARAVELIQTACAEVGAALLCVSHDVSLKQRFPHVHAMQDLSAAAPA